MLEWIKRLFGPEPEPAPQIITRPIVLNAQEEEQINNAYYRLDAIRRYIEQTAVISTRKRREFLTETIAHADLLFRRGRIDETQHDELINTAIADRAKG